VLRDIISVDLKLALQQPGCPVCRLRSKSELRYIRSLLWEFVNDPLTRDHFIVSFGYCSEHTWQMGLLENERCSCPLGTAIMYEHLSSVVQGQLAVYARWMDWTQRSWWRRCLQAIWPWSSQRLRAHELQPEACCRVCQIGDQSERRYLEWLLRELSGPDNDFREWYAASDGLCLPHLRQGLATANRSMESGARFVVETTLRRLGALQRDLSEFERKNAWNNRHEPKSEAEKTAWLRALTFFGGSQAAAQEVEGVHPLTE